MLHVKSHFMDLSSRYVVNNCGRGNDEQCFTCLHVDVVDRLQTHHMSRDLLSTTTRCLYLYFLDHVQQQKLIM